MKAITFVLAIVVPAYFFYLSIHYVEWLEAEGSYGVYFPLAYAVYSVSVLVTIACWKAAYSYWKK